MIGERLKKLRNAKKLTISSAAEIFGVASRTYSSYEAEEREPNLTMLCKFADYYGVTTDYLLGRESDETLELSKEFNMTALEKYITEEFLKLEKNMRDDLMEFMQKSVKNIMNESSD